MGDIVSSIMDAGVGQVVICVLAFALLIYSITRGGKGKGNGSGTGGTA